MDSSVLKHPRIAEIVDSLVAARGGRLTYDTGCGGREILIAAGAHLAAQTGAQLTIVEARVLHSEVRALVNELQPDIRSAVISADEAAQQRAGTTGVLAVHADVLRNADVREPLLAMAHSADHLVVARHDYSDTTLDSLAAPGLVLRSHDLLPTATPTPGPRLGAAERRETASQPGTLASGPRALAAAHLWTRLSSEERKERFNRQLNHASEEQKLELDEFVREALSADPAEVRRRLEQLKEQGQRRAADYPVLAPGPADRGHGHGEEQSAAHQQHRPQGPGRT